MRSPTGSACRRAVARATVLALSLLAPAAALAQPSAPPARAGAEGRACGTGDEVREIQKLIESMRGDDGTTMALGGPSGPSPDFGDLFVVEDDGTLTFFGITDSPRIVRRFYETWRDDFDFVAIYNDFDAIPEFGFAYNEPVVNGTSGLGIPLSDKAEEMRLPTARLLSYQNCNSLLKYADDPRAPVPGLFDGLLDSVEVVAHEVGHQWMSKLRLVNGDLLGRNQVHWSFVFNVRGSVMEGNTIADNGDGTFTTVDALNTYSALDQYLMGLRRGDEVPPQWVLENWTGPPDVLDDAVFPKLDVTLVGTRRDFGIADVLTANGPRVPAAGDAPCVFHIAFVLLAKEGEFPPSPATLEKLSRIRLGYESFFRQETGGRGYLVSTLCPPEAEIRHVVTASAGAGDLSGRAVSGGVDVNGDGVADWAVGAPSASAKAGSAAVFDGRSGARLALVGGTDAAGEAGSALALLRDADGIAGGEVAIGAPQAQNGAGRVRVVSVAGGGVLHAIPGDAAGDGYGSALAALKDLNGDGRSDLAVGAPGASGGRGFVRLVSGADGSTIRTIPGEAAGERFGESLASVADADGDGMPDLLVGAPGFTPAAGLESAGRARVVSTATGGVIRTVEGAEAGARLGASVASVPDADGDGAPDWIAGAPGTAGGRGAAIVVSGASGATLRTLEGSGGSDAFGSAVAGLVDASGDDRGEVAVGAPGARPAARVGAGAVLVFSGADGSLLTAIPGAAPRDGLGAALASSGSSFITGAPRESGIGAATVRSIESFHLFSLGYPKAGRTISLEVWGEPSERYAIVASPRAGSRITPIPYPNGPGAASALDVGLDRRDLTRTVPGFRGRLDANGRAAVEIRIPNRPALVGRTVGFQAVSLNANGTTPKIRRLSRPVIFAIR